MKRLTSLAKYLLYSIIRILFGEVYAARFIGVYVGKDCRIFTKHFGSEPWLIKIGDGVTVTTGVKFITHDGSLDLIKDHSGRRYRFGPITIGNNVFIGVDAILLPGVKIGSNVVVAAGSVLTKSVPDSVVVAGNPARIIKKFEDYKDNALALFPALSDMGSGSYRERVNRVVDWKFRNELFKV